MEVQYIDHMGSDLTVVNAARVSFHKESEWELRPEDTEWMSPYQDLKDTDKRLINYLARHNHWTPFAHPQVTLRVKAPIFVRTQCFKHKQGFVENEVSRRYVDDAPEFFSPASWRSRPVLSKQGSGDLEIKTLPHGTFGTQTVDEAYEKLLNHAQDLYKLMIEEGVAPEQARMILPQSMYTEWYWTGSLAAYARFYKQRTDPTAQQEIKDLAKMVGDIIQPLYPVSWKELVS